MEEGVDKERNEAMGRRRMERREQQMRARLLMMLGAVGRGDGGLMVATIGGVGKVCGWGPVRGAFCLSGAGG